VSLWRNGYTMKKPVKTNLEKFNEVEDVLSGKVILSQDEIDKCKTAVNRTYSTIASDAGISEDAPAHEILEVVLDADYVKSYGGISDELYIRFKTWVQQELAKGGSWKVKYTRIAKVIW
jgi:hypothetical protein